MNGKSIQISDTIHGTVKLNFIEKRVISDQIFNRLHSISQNSTVYLTFPTNRTRRFEHSIGTMALCGKMFHASILNSDESTLNDFFQSIEKIIDSEINHNLHHYSDKYRSKIGDRNLTPTLIEKYKKAKIPNEYIPFIPVNVNEKYRNLYVILFQAVRLSALMHDVGHPPFSHITEFALKNIWIKVGEIETHNRTDRQNKFLAYLNKYFENQHDLHEQIGNNITNKVLDSMITIIPDGELTNKEYVSNQLFQILTSEITSALLQEKKQEFLEIHKIIDGTLDGDRLDYVSRDPVNSGLNVGIIEYDRIINSMRLVKVGSNFLFSPSLKVIDSIEDFFSRRWRMYKQIIYHHRVIKTDYLLQNCIEELALDYLSKDNIEIDNINILPYDISGLWKAIKDNPSHSQFFDSLIQWDDSWLLTILKKHYFEKIIGDESITSYKLEELLANKKNYYSLIKRMEDFSLIDKEIAKVMQKEYDDINNIINEIKNGESNKEGTVAVDMDSIFNYIKRLEEVIVNNCKDESYIPKEGFVLPKIRKIYNNLFDEDSLDKIIYNCVSKLKSESDYNIKDIITIVKKPKTGIQGGKTWEQGGLGLYKIIDGNLNVKKFDELSNVSGALVTDINYMPAFYVYILKNNNNELEFEKIKTKLGNEIGGMITGEIKRKLQEISNLILK